MFFLFFLLSWRHKNKSLSNLGGTIFLLRKIKRILVHTEKYFQNLFEIFSKSFRNLMKSNWNQILVTIFLLIWNQTDVRLIPNQSENSNYNLISVSFDKILERFLSVYAIHMSFICTYVHIHMYICMYILICTYVHMYTKYSNLYLNTKYKFNTNICLFICISFNTQILNYFVH